jgi:GNAT superfamily N-acetyltransferase
MYYELSNGEFILSTDPSRLDVVDIHEFLSRSYWANHRPRETFEKAVKNSLCFGVYSGRRQIGFARVVTDYATFAYLADVYIVELFRGRGLAKWLVTSILSHPDLKQVRRWLLTTRDAHKLYRGCGFSELKEPEHHMQLLQPYPGELPARGRVSKRLAEHGKKLRGPGKRTWEPRKPG